jgi:hypothetical protein
MSENQYTENETYVLNLPYHLAECGNGNDLLKYLLEFEFLQYKYRAARAQALLEDYQLALQSDIKFAEEHRSCLTAIRDAIVLSADIIDRDQTQFAGQLTARLLGSKLIGIQRLLDEIRSWAGLPWLRPTLPVLTVPGGPLLKTLRGHRGWISALVVTSAGRQVVSTDGYSIKVWDIASGREMLSFSPDAFSTIIAATPDGKKIAYSGNNDIHVLDVGTGKNILLLTGHTGSVRAITLTPDGNHLVSGSSDKSIRFWELETGRELLTLTGHTDAIKVLAVTPNGKQLITGSSDNTYKIWDISGGRELFSFEEPSDSPIYARNIAVTPDSKYLVCSRSSEILILNLITGTSRQTIENCGWRLYSTVLSADGKYIISSSADNYLRVWDFKTGEPIGNLRGHHGQVFSLAASSTDNFVLSGSHDTTIKIWDMSNPTHGPNTVHAPEPWVRPFDWMDFQGNVVR